MRPICTSEDQMDGVVSSRGLRDDSSRNSRAEEYGSSPPDAMRSRRSSSAGVGLHQDPKAAHQLFLDYFQELLGPVAATALVEVPR